MLVDSPLRTSLPGSAVVSACKCYTQRMHSLEPLQAGAADILRWKGPISNKQGRRPWVFAAQTLCTSAVVKSGGIFDSMTRNIPGRMAVNSFSRTESIPPQNSIFELLAQLWASAETPSLAQQLFVVGTVHRMFWQFQVRACLSNH